MQDIEKKLGKEWVQKALGSVNFSGEEKISDELLNEEAVVLLQGTNMFGDRVYSYTKLRFRDFRRLRDDMIAGKDFRPSDYGEVVRAGRGEPTQEVKDEMGILYKMVDIPSTSGVKPVNTSAPRLFNQDNDE